MSGIILLFAIFVIVWDIGTASCEYFDVFPDCSLGRRAFLDPSFCTPGLNNYVVRADMSHKEDQEIWTCGASRLLGSAESTVLVLIGIALVLVALLLLYAGLH